MILEPGIGDFSVEWSLVQPEVAKTARICSYDRAGDGWSEMGPRPRTATVPHANDPPRDKLPDDARKMRTWARAQIGHIAAGVNPVEVEEIALLRKEPMDDPQAYGDIPLIVITRGRAESDWTAAKEEARRAAHKAIASASRRGRWLLAGRAVLFDSAALTRGRS